jgi:hypothetical protein
VPSVPFRACNSLDELHSSSQQEEPLSGDGFEELPDPGPHDLAELRFVSFQKEGHDQAPKSENRKQNARLRYRKKRLVGRIETQLAEGTTLKAVSLKKRSASASQMASVSCTYEEDFEPSKPAWMAQRDMEKDEREYSLQELVEVHGMTIIAWDGK